MSSSFDKLVQIMGRLRGPDGCPWDHQQTHESIVPQLIEETYEVVEAIEKRNSLNLSEELGDLLLHVVFHAQMAQEEGTFTIDDVVSGITQKLIRRHPHVFGDTQVDGAEEVIKNWDKIKDMEKASQGYESLLSGVPRSLPGLQQAYKLTKKASKVGFDWQQTEEVIKKIEEEIEELKEVLTKTDQKEIEHEIGDLFFTLANICRHIHVHPEEALRGANGRFRERFGYMEKKVHQKGKEISDLSMTEMDQLWEEAKKQN